MSDPDPVAIAALEVLMNNGVVIGGSMDNGRRVALAREISENIARRTVSTGDWEIRYRRFRDEPGTHAIWSTGHRDEQIIDFIDLVLSGPFNAVGDMASQDTEKGYAEVWLWYGGRSD